MTISMSFRLWKRRDKAALAALALAVSFTVARAQNPVSLDLSRKDGYPEGPLYDMLQDSRGYIWVASDRGIARFDGQRFTSFTFQGDYSAAGSSLREDIFGRVWYETFDGELFYVSGDRLLRLAKEPSGHFIPFELSSRYLYSIQEDKFIIYDLKTLKSINSISLPDDRLFTPYTLLNRLYITSADYVTVINEDLAYYTVKNPLNGSRGRTLMTSDGINLYLAPQENRQGIILKTNKNLEIKGTIKLKQSFYINWLFNSGDHLYICSRQGLYVYDTTGNLLNHFYKEADVTDALMDYRKNLWISTLNDGLKLIPNPNNVFVPFNNFEAVTFESHNNKIWLATTEAEILEMNKTNGQIKGVFKGEDKLENIYYIYYDSVSRNLYFSSNYGFHYIKTESVDKARTTFKNLNIKSACRVDSAYMAVAGNSVMGLFRTSAAPSAWAAYFEDLEGPYPHFHVLKKNVRARKCVYNATDTTLYFLTNDGTYYVTPESFGEIFSPDNDKLILSNAVSVDGKVVGLSPRGVLYLLSIKSAKRITVSEFIEPDNIYAQKNILFIRKSKGLFAWYSQAKKPDYLGSLEPALSDYFLFFLLRNDTLLIFGKKGFYSHSRKYDDTQKCLPLLHIHAIKTNNEVFSHDQVIRLNEKENSISIHFSFLNYGDESGAPLGYALNDAFYSQAPVQAGLIDLPNLEAGNYRLKFYYQGKSLEPTIYFVIRKAFWKEWWFSGLLIALIGSGAFLYSRFQVRLLKQRIRLTNENLSLKIQLNKSIIKSIKSQLNPHFFFNALNTIQAYIFKNEKEKAAYYLSRFSQLTRLILDHSELECISLADEIKFLDLYLSLEKMRFSENFTYEISVAENLDTEFLKIPPLLVQPFVENALKHGLLHKKGPRFLAIRFYLKKHTLFIEIEDNGIGRKRSAEINKAGRAQNLFQSSTANQKRMDLMKKLYDKPFRIIYFDKMDAFNMPAGTLVTLEIPLYTESDHD